MRLHVSPRARRDLNQIFCYWAQRASVEVADRLIDEITERMALLAQMPQIGRRCDQTAPSLLNFPVGKYVIYYRKGKGAIHIVHVFHAARDQGEAFAKE